MNNYGRNRTDYNDIKRAEPIHNAALVLRHCNAERHPYDSGRKPAYKIQQQGIWYFFRHNVGDFHVGIERDAAPKISVEQSDYEILQLYRHWIKHAQVAQISSLFRIVHALVLFF